MNETLSRFETIKKFRVIDVEPTIENGLLTPTFKLKRGLVEKRFKSLVDEMYGE
jgi:long-chain acyl-CoA synthetase